MGILDDLLLRVQDVAGGITTGTLIGGVVQNHPVDIMKLQREQLLCGKSSSGEDIRPFYSEDVKPHGYFNSVESAKRYANWKSGLSYPSFRGERRNSDAPNLYINGKFHNELGVRFSLMSVAVVPETSYAAKIVAKYGTRTFGLTMDRWTRIFEEYGAYNELMNEIKSILYV